MHVRKLTLRNFQCFRGEHTIELEPKVYAVTAQYVGDAERSNWAGKSSCLEAIVFALYGVHRHEHADGWISEGEKSGEVVVEFDDGSRIVRARHLGKPTRLTYNGRRPDTDEIGDATKDEAQTIVLERVGLSQKDFFATCYFEQRAMSRFITADAGARTEIVADWLRLGPLQRCEAECREYVTTKIASVTDLERSEMVSAEIERAGLDGSKDVAELENDLKECRSDLVAAEITMKEASTRLQKNAQLVEVAGLTEELEALRVEGRGLAAEVAEIDQTVSSTALKDAKEELVLAKTVVARHREDRDRKLVVARGEFDGKCPVADIECPARTQINAQRTTAQVGLERVELFLKSAEALERERNRFYVEADEAATLYDRKVMRLESLREKDRQLREKLLAIGDEDEVVSSESLQEEYDKAQRAVTELRVEEQGISERIKAVRKSSEVLAQIRADLERHRIELATHREALAIFGKNGAQRRVAENALDEIEQGANAMLQTCGIALQVGVEWSREGQGFATSCDACGNPYPTSAKVKACARCGAERGPKLINKLDVTLTNRSGAAEDLAGAAIQLSASSWLRGDRESAWGTALIDEPFGMLDKAHRRQFAAHLTTMLSGRYGFSQALVISHSPDVTDSLPGRILITSDGKWSSVRVVS